MTTAHARSPKARWCWSDGGSRLFGVDGAEYLLVGDLRRVEIERLLSLGELDAVRITCGGGVKEWAPPREARRMWTDLQGDFEDVPDWRPPSGAPGAFPYRAELRRADDGRHVIVFVDE